MNENCSTCVQDCACDPGTQCSDSQCVPVPGGEGGGPNTTCGDGYCDPGESCTKDCGRPRENLAPIANPGGPYSAAAHTPVLFYDASSDPEGPTTIVNVQWNYGDGSTGQGVFAPHIYAVPGVYRVRVVVTDEGGLSSRASTTATITDPVGSLPAYPRGWIRYSPDRGVLGVFGSVSSPSRDVEPLIQCFLYHDYKLEWSYDGQQPGIEADTMTCKHEIAGPAIGTWSFDIEYLLRDKKTHAVVKGQGRFREQLVIGENPPIEEMPTIVGSAQEIWYYGRDQPITEYGNGRTATEVTVKPETADPTACQWEAFGAAKVRSNGCKALVYSDAVSRDRYDSRVVLRYRGMFADEYTLTVRSPEYAFIEYQSPVVQYGYGYRAETTYQAIDNYDDEVRVNLEFKEQQTFNDCNPGRGWGKPAMTTRGSGHWTDEIRMNCSSCTPSTTSPYDVDAWTSVCGFLQVWWARYEGSLALGRCVVQDDLDLYRGNVDVHSDRPCH